MWYQKIGKIGSMRRREECKNASLWPEEGNLLHLMGVSIVHEVDTEGKEVYQGNSDDEMMSVGGDVLGND
eukprot:11586229-Ditylum_brightwellii.AAC.1